MRTIKRPNGEEMEVPDRKLLIVDDDRDIVDVLNISLKAGCQGISEILLAYDGNAACSIFEESRPEVVVLDIMLPGRSGFLVLEKMKKDRPGELAICCCYNWSSRKKA